MTQPEDWADQKDIALFERLSQSMDGSGDFVQDSANLLTIGKEYLGVENGHIARIDPASNFWETIGSSDPESDEFPVGLTVDLGETYCRRTIEQDTTIALHDASEQGWEHDAAYERHHLETYIGTPYTVNDQLYGTVCFVSREPREQPFTEKEIAFVEFLAQLIKQTLEQRRAQQILSEKEEILDTFSRVLRHNLSNSLNVVHGQAELLEQRADEGGDQHVETIKRNSTQLLALAEKCRDLQNIVNNEHKRTQIDLESIILAAAETVSPDYPDASISVNCQSDTSVHILPVLKKALIELIENAAKHTGESPTVEIRTIFHQDSFIISILDDGDGLQESEQKVVEDGYEEPLAHGSGIGLWMAYWIVRRHDGHIEVSTSDAGTVFDVTIPYATAKIPGEIGTAKNP